MQEERPDLLPESIERQIESFCRQPRAAAVAALERLCREYPEHGHAIRGLAMLYSIGDEAALEQIGPYEIRSLLGEGGMGSVFLAEQSSPVKRRVAIKVIKLGMASKQIIARFEAERQSLAVMEHSNIAKVFDGGLTDDGRPYFVMEYVDGEPLTNHCDRHQLDLDERLSLFRQVCAGVQHAHQKGVIHRDLKPSNILVAIEDGEPRPKIIDFGLARATERGQIQASLFTQQGQVLGTPEYMSPEQASTSGANDVDTRSDVYSLGVVLYELLVGELPFRIDYASTVDFAEIQRRIREDDPERPSSRASSLDAPRDDARRTWFGRLRGDLDQIVLKALAKEPDRRYRSPSRLAEDIGRFLNHRPVEARAPGTRYRVRKFVRRHRVAVATATTIASVLVAGIVVSTWFAFGESNARAAAVANLERFDLLALDVRLRAAKAAQRDFDPGWPEQAPAIRAWLDGEATAMRQALPKLRATVAALRETALAWTEEDRATDRSAHPRWQDFQRATQRLAGIRYADDVRNHRREPEKFELDEIALGLPISRLINAASRLVGPNKTEFGRAAEALALLERARELGPKGSEAVLVGMHRGWALFDNGLDDEARAAMASVEAMLMPRHRPGFKRTAAQLESLIADARTSAPAERIATLERAVDTLEAAVDVRATFRFAQERDQVLHDSLTRTTLEIERFEDEEIRINRERVEWARRFEHASSTFASRWKEVTDDLAAGYGFETASESIVYLEPQVGLVPIGRNPVSDLWEFYDLRSAANPDAIPKHRADGSIEVDGDTGIVFVLIPPVSNTLIGEQVRDPSQPNYSRTVRPAEKLGVATLGPFLISRYEMTQGQWLRLSRGETPSRHDAEKPRSDGVSTTRAHPVEQVSWHDCASLLLQYRLQLPTEAQWEYACRAGTGTRWSTGENSDSLRGFANISGAIDRKPRAAPPGSSRADRHPFTAPVGTYAPNRAGLHDMHGNVAEWCKDTFFEAVVQLRENDHLRRAGPGPRSYRGGDYSSSAEDVRSARRFEHEPNIALPTLGLRPIRPIF